MDIQNLLERYKIDPDVTKDQFFVDDDDLIKRIVDFAEICDRDVVLEVGAGTGTLTKELAKKAKRVIAFEIDNRFKPVLDNLPKNVDLHYENAWEYIQLHGKYRHKKEYNKVVSNLPYSFAEQFLHNLTFLEYDKVILMVPIKMVNKISENPVFGSFFETKLLLEVPKQKFYPMPKTNSAVIDLVKLPDPRETKNSGLFLRQYMYQHEQQLVKNSLMEGIIKYARLVHKKSVTKNEARKIVSEKITDKALLEKLPDNPEVYKLVEEVFI